MKFIPIKTRAYIPPKDEIWPELDKLKLKNGDILVITSKILAIHQGRCIKIGPKVNKRELIKSEAEEFVLNNHISQRTFMITIKDYTLIPSAGIDESNANGYYILWPKHTNRLLKEIHNRLTKKIKYAT